MLEMWGDGEKNRPVRLYRVCGCRICQQHGKGKGVGFLSGSDADGNGFTLWIEDESQYVTLTSIFEERGPSLPDQMREEHNDPADWWEKGAPDV